MSKFVGTRPSSYEKKRILGRGLTKVEKHWYNTYNNIYCGLKLYSLAS